jgi:uncharacterized Rmd1/YagE family protein
VYSNASSLDLGRLAGRLEAARSRGKTSFSGPPSLLSTPWKAKAHFDALHLAASRLTRVESARHSKSEEHAEQTWRLYDTEVSEGDGPFGAQQSDGGEDNPETDVMMHKEDLASVLDVFLFSFGAVVFWGFNSEQDERAFLSELSEFVDGPRHHVSAAESAMEEMEFTYGEHSRVRQDIVELTTSTSGEKLAASMAIAQSCLLSVHEWRLGQTISRNEHIPSELAGTGAINMSSGDIAREIGRLFVERNLINLEPILLDTPEFLWNDDSACWLLRFLERLH